MARIVIQEILPKQKIRPERLEREIELLLKGVVKEVVKKPMKQTVKGWKNPPQMVGRYSTFQGAAGSMHVFPRDQGEGFGSSTPGRKANWTRVSQGTRGRTITATRAPYLVIRKYQPHTRPGSYKSSGPGFYVNSTRYLAKSVWNPGIRARNFEELIVQEIKPSIIALFDASFRKLKLIS